MSILDNAKGIAQAVHEINNLELYQRVLALHSDIIELVEQNNQLRQEVAELRRRLEIKGKLQPVMERDLIYFVVDEQGRRESGPYCTTCWDIDGKLVHVYPYGDGTHICNYCLSHRPRGC
jgi:regulator of replication initiation timing